jgi:hypothetical protein
VDLTATGTITQIRLDPLDGGVAGAFADVAFISHALPEFRIVSIATESNDVRIAWTTLGGERYALQAGETNFVDISPTVVAPGGGISVTNRVDSAALTNQPARFYRVRQLP